MRPSSSDVTGVPSARTPICWPLTTGSKLDQVRTKESPLSILSCTTTIDSASIWSAATGCGSGASITLRNASVFMMAR